MLAVLAVFAFYVNRGIVIKGLYMDDLYMWSCYGEQSFTEFVFPIGTSARFRPVYWLATWLQMAIIGNHVHLFAAFNIVCNLLLAWSVYYIVTRMTDSIFLSFAVSAAFLASRFAYYQIGQALGLMETLAQFFALWMLYELWRFMRAELCFLPEEEKEKAGQESARPLYRLPQLQLSSSPEGSYLLALLFYLLLVFTHERYIVLVPLFYLVLIVRLLRRNRAYRKADVRSFRRLWIWPAALLVFVIAVRRLATGRTVPAGTGGTLVTETFQLRQCLRFVLSQLLYLAGVNDGPEHLCGLPWEATPANIKSLVKVSVLCLVLIITGFLALLLKECRSRRQGGGAAERLYMHLADCLLFGGFIGACIACSSVTIRVEMRWIYVSYTAMLIFAAYMTDQAGRGLLRGQAQALQADPDREPPAGRAGGVFRGFLYGLFGLYCALSIAVSIFYRGYFDRLYFWPNQLRMNSLAEQTVEAHGTEYVLDSDVYILENTYDMSRFYADTFFKTFDPQRTAENNRVIFAENIEEVRQQADPSRHCIVLREVPENNAYEEVPLF